MTPQEITEKNRLIAEFMGKTIENRGSYNVVKENPDDTHGAFESILSYHKTWEALMPVVFKFDSISQQEMGYDAFTPISQCQSYLRSYPIATPIEDIYKCICYCISIYNQQKQ